jgi:hypothetical protein
MSELFNTLLVELGERIAQNTKTIIDNQKEIEYIISDSTVVKGAERVAELIGANKQLQIENREYIMIQLRLRSFLRNQNQSTLLKIEESSGFWIDEKTEHFLLSNGNGFLKSESINADKVEKKGDNHINNGISFDFRDSKFNNIKVPANLIEQCVRNEKYELCSMLISVYSSRN